MKSIFFVFFISSLTVQAQYQADHAIEVKRFTNWAPDYLTVTNTWNNMCFIPSAPSLKCLSVITEINGESTDGMDPEEFYSILDSSESFSLSYLTKSNGENKEYRKHFTKRKGKLLITPYGLPIKPQTISILSDMDVDFFKINTFDYRLAGDDQLMDKTLMEVFADQLRSKGLKRVEENPDIYLYITKDVNQKIESMYVPEYTTTTQTGSTGIGIHNFLGVSGLNVGGSTGKATTVTRDDGHMRTNVNAEAYLEFSILDSRKLNSKKAPVIWQLTYNEYKTEEIRLLESVKNWIGSWALEYPFHESVMRNGAFTWGIFCKNFTSNPTISDIYPGSKADLLGCKVGEEIKFVRYADNDENSCTYRPGQSFYGYKLIPTTTLMQVGKKKITKGGLTENIKYKFIY
ncbi:hypothetical protein [Coprobacter sp.]